jgi:hypothetical protein
MYLSGLSGLFKLLQRLRVGHFAVAQSLYYFKDLGPGGEGPCVLSFIFIDGHKKLKLLVRHLAFFGGFSLICSASAGPAIAVKAQAPVNNTLSAVFAAPSLYVVFLVHLSDISQKW